MPQYYSVPDWRDRGKVTVTPKSFWRRLPIIGNIIPYYVGNQVEFTVHIEKPLQWKDIIGAFCVWEKFGDVSKNLHDVNQIDSPIKGNRISVEGNIEYYLGYSIPSPSEITTTIFTAHALSWDSIRNQISWIILAAILGGIITLFISFLLGFIKINPALIATW